MLLISTTAIRGGYEKRPDAFTPHTHTLVIPKKTYILIELDRILIEKCGHLKLFFHQYSQMGTSKNFSFLEVFLRFFCDVF